MQTDEWRPYELCKENDERAKINRAWNVWIGIDYGYQVVRVEDWGYGTPPGNHEDGRRFRLTINSESSAEMKLVGDLNKRLSGAAERERQELDELTRMTSKQWSAYMRSPGPLGGYQIPRTPKVTPLGRIVDDAARRFDERPLYRASIEAQRELRQASMPQNFGTPPRRETAVERGMRFHRHLEQEIDVQADLLRRYPRLFDLSDAND